MASSDSEDSWIKDVADGSKSDSVIVIDDSLTEDPQLSHDDGLEEKQTKVRIPKYPLLESVGARFAQNRQEQAERIRANKTKREVELAHSQYLKRNVASPVEVAAARPIVKAWADKNDVVGKEKRKQIHVRRRITADPGHSNPTNVRSDTSCNATRVSVCNKSPLQSTSERASSHTLAWDNTQQYDFANFPQESAINEDVNLVCSVLNCSAQFSSWPRLANHQNLFAHSPCNPLLKIEDIKFPPDPLSYICAACDAEFMDKDKCEQHISVMDHLPFYPPIAVGAYMCPQCLLLFSSFQDCYRHFESSGHTSIAYPFSDDSCHGDIMPVPVAIEMARDFCEQCQSVDFFLQCLDCELLITSQKALRDHKNETNGQHTFVALTDSNLMDIFATYLNPDNCLNCKRLCSKEDQKNNTHHCPSGKSGQIVKNGCRSFTEFVKCCGLTLMKSRDTSKTTRSDRLLEPNSTHSYSKLEISDQISDKGKQQTETSAPNSKNIPSNGEANKKKRKPSGPPDTHTKKRLKETGHDSIQNNHDESLGGEIDQNKHGGSNPQEIVDSSVEENPGKNLVSPTDPENLKAMNNILFLDLDNWPSFFKKLPRSLPDKTFVWGFFGGGTVWKEPINTYVYKQQKSRGLFYLNDQCGRTKDAADVAIVLTVGKMDVLLPKHVAFTILSGDKCFVEIERHMTKRKVVVIDPHSAQKFSDDMIYTMVTSVMET